MNVSQDLSILHLILNASAVVQVVKALLASVSFMSWYYIFRQGFSLGKAKAQPEQLAEQVNLFAQTRIDFRHDRPLRLGIEPSACTERLVLTSTRRMAMTTPRAG